MAVNPEILNKVRHSLGEELPLLLTTVNSIARGLSCFLDQVKLV